MKIEVVFETKKNKLNLKRNSTIEDALKLLKINSETVLVKRNNEIIPSIEKLKDGDKIEALKIISGG